MCVFVCNLFQPSSIDSVGDGTYCECVYITRCMCDLFSSHFHVFECFVRWHSSNLNWFNTAAAAEVTATFPPLGVSISLSLILAQFLSLSLSLSHLCPTLPLSALLSSLWLINISSWLSASHSISVFILLNKSCHNCQAYAPDFLEWRDIQSFQEHFSDNLLTLGVYWWVVCFLTETNWEVPASECPSLSSSMLR